MENTDKKTFPDEIAVDPECTFCDQKCSNRLLACKAGHVYCVECFRSSIQADINKGINRPVCNFNCQQQFTSDALENGPTEQQKSIITREETSTDSTEDANDSESNFKRCHGCKAPYVRGDGCNKIICTRCYATWCDVCNESKLEKGHFTTDPKEEPDKCPYWPTTDNS
jgi:hypothetical protein